MKDYKINTGRKMIKNNKKTSWCNESRKDSSLFAAAQMVLESRSAGHKNSQIYLLYIRQTFQMVSEEVSSARRAADQDKNKKQLGDTAKLKGNSFYGKMIENLEKHISTSSQQMKN